MSEPLIIAPIPRVSLTATSAAFDAGLDYRGWIAAGRQLGRIAGASQFWIGDWINFAAQKAEGQAEPAPNGESWSKYAEALEVTGLEYDYLRGIAWVARCVGTNTRREDLTFQHHREVAALQAKEQKAFLQKAAKGDEGVRWTVSRLRQEIRKMGGGLASPAEPDPGLMKWARPAGDLVRFLKQEDSEEPIEQWPAERKEAVRMALKDVKELVDRLWS